MARYYEGPYWVRGEEDEQWRDYDRRWGWTEQDSQRVARDAGRGWYWSTELGRHVAVGDGTTTTHDVAAQLAAGTGGEKLAAQFWVEAAHLLNDLAVADWQAVNATLGIHDRSPEELSPVERRVLHAAQDRVEAAVDALDRAVTIAQYGSEQAGSAAQRRHHHEVQKVYDLLFDPAYYVGIQGDGQAEDNYRDHTWATAQSYVATGYTAADLAAEHATDTAAIWGGEDDMTADELTAERAQQAGEHQGDQEGLWAELDESPPGVSAAFWTARAARGADQDISPAELRDAYTAAGLPAPADLRHVAADTAHDPGEYHHPDARASTAPDGSRQWSSREDGNFDALALWSPRTLDPDPITARHARAVCEQIIRETAATQVQAVGALDTAWREAARITYTEHVIHRGNDGAPDTDTALPAADTARRDAAIGLIAEQTGLPAGFIQQEIHQAAYAHGQAPGTDTDPDHLAPPDWEHLTAQWAHHQGYETNDTATNPGDYSDDQDRREAEAEAIGRADLAHAAGLDPPAVAPSELAGPDHSDPDHDPELQAHLHGDRPPWPADLPGYPQDQHLADAREVRAQERVMDAAGSVAITRAMVTFDSPGVLAEAEQAHAQALTQLDARTVDADPWAPADLYSTTDVVGADTQRGTDGPPARQQTGAHAAAEPGAHATLAAFAEDLPKVTGEVARDAAASTSADEVLAGLIADLDATPPDPYPGDEAYQAQLARAEVASPDSGETASSVAYPRIWTPEALREAQDIIDRAGPQSEAGRRAELADRDAFGGQDSDATGPDPGPPDPALTATWIAAQAAPTEPSLASEEAFLTSEPTPAVHPWNTPATPDGRDVMTEVDGGEDSGKAREAVAVAHDAVAADTQRVTDDHAAPQHIGAPAVAERGAYDQDLHAAGLGSGVAGAEE